MMGRKSIAEIRRGEIIEAFYEVVSAKGFMKATVRETAKAAGCSYRMLHHYFANKEEIILALIDHLTKENLPDFRKELSELATSTERWEYWVSAMSTAMPRQFSLEFCRAVVDCWALTKTYPSVSDAVKEYYNQYRDMMVELIREGIESGELRKVQPEVAANIMMAVLEGMLMLWVVNPDGISMEAVSKDLPELWQRYFMPEN